MAFGSRDKAAPAYKGENNEIVVNLLESRVNISSLYFIYAKY